MIKKGGRKTVHSNDHFIVLLFCQSLQIYHNLWMGRWLPQFSHEVPVDILLDLKLKFYLMMKEIKKFMEELCNSADFRSSEACSHDCKNKGKVVWRASTDRSRVNTGREIIELGKAEIQMKLDLYIYSSVPNLWSQVAIFQRQTGITSQLRMTPCGGYDQGIYIPPYCIRQWQCPETQMVQRTPLLLTSGIGVTFR
ncbi:hypothetical protein FRX31_012226 [Thalictrum thalictroides]|uniref:Uncharacterized protein n=1 Tax=Thalictrum thalictroides TaxID=46969 RepID=A0A7J6WLD9_THATH|nr:hypothetical protein FRX31_012226 [Thalictrum thalictroides]